MALSGASLSIASGGLGLSSKVKLPPCVVGCSSAGPLATPTPISTVDDITSTFGFGPLAEALALYLVLAGAPVYGMRATSDVSGVASPMIADGGGGSNTSSVTHTGTGTAVCVLGGTPTVPSAVLITVTHAASNLAGSPKISVSLDGGVTTFPAAVAAAGPVSIGNGLSLAITDGTFVVGDTYTAVATPAQNSGSATLGVSGTPNDQFNLLVKVSAAGANLAAGTATFQYSLDGGNSWSENIGAAATYVIPNTGLTLAWTDGTFVVGDGWYGVTSAPSVTTSLSTAMNALFGSGVQIDFIHLAQPADATGAAGAASTVAAFQEAGRYIWALVEARDQLAGESVTAWRTAIEGASPGFSGYTSDVIAASVGAAYIQSGLRKNVYWRRNVGRLLGPRIASIVASEHPGRVKSGPVQGLMPDGNTSSVIHNLSVYPDLDTARFCGIQTITGRPRGEYYFTATTMASLSSDFQLIPRIRVMDLAATAALAALALEVNDTVPTKTDGSGQIDPAAAIAIEADLNAALRKAVVKAPNAFASAASATVNRTDNILTSQTLRVTLAVVPFGQVTSVSAVISYSLTA